MLVALLNLAIGFAPGIDNSGHLSGLIAGIVLTWFLGPILEPVNSMLDELQVIDQRPWISVRGKTTAVALILLAIAFAVII